MADLSYLTTFFLDGDARTMIGDTYDPGFNPDAFKPWCDVLITPKLLGTDDQEIRLVEQTTQLVMLLIPIRARLETGVLKLVREPAPSMETPDAEEFEEQEESVGVPLIAETPELELPTGVHLAYKVQFGPMKVSGGSYKFNDFTFMAPGDNRRLNIASVERVNLPPSTSSTVVVRMIPDDVQLTLGGQIQFYAHGVPLGDPLTVGGGGGGSWVEDPDHPGLFLWAMTPPDDPDEPAAVTITTTGATFSPEVELAPGSTATVHWAWSGGSTTGLTPTINFGSAATRTVTMTVLDTDDSDAIADVVTFNIGYDNLQDPGLYMAPGSYNHTAQAVTGLGNVNAMVNLVRFLASTPNLAGALDFTGMAELEFIELYQSNVTAATLAGCDSLIRLDLEQCNVTTLDLNPVHATLRDLRAANQNGGASGLTFAPLTGGNVMEDLYHYCVRDQAVTGHFTLAQMPALEELWNWNTGQTGTLNLGGSTALRELWCYDNDYTAVTGIAGAAALSWLRFAGNDLDTADVDQIINDVEALGTSGSRTLDLGTLNRTAGSTSDISALTGRGWTVTVGSISSSWSFTDLFGSTLDAAALEAAGYIRDTENGAASSADWNTTGGNLVKNNSGSYQLLVNDGDGLAPVNYEVEVVFPHAALSTAYWFIVAKYNPANGTGIRVGWGGTPGTLVAGGAINAIAGDAAPTADAGPTWVGTGDHTMIIRVNGTTVNIYTDGTLAAHFTTTTNQASTGTYFGVGGGSSAAYRSLVARTF